jgi:hypothetical protein
MVENPWLFLAWLLLLCGVPSASAFSFMHNFLTQSKRSDVIEETHSTMWQNIFYRILSFFPSSSLFSLSISDSIILLVISFTLFSLLVLVAHFVLLFSTRISINQQITPLPSSQISSLSSTEVDLNEIDWPQFDLEEDIPFEDFIQNFEEIFQTEKIDPSKKYACFRRCLTSISPALLKKSRALIGRDYETAVARLRPVLTITDDQRTETLKKQYATVQQSRDQSLPQYYDTFTKFRATHPLSEEHAREFFYEHLSSLLRSHLFHVYYAANDAQLSLHQFYKRITHYLQECPLRPPPAATIHSAPLNSRPTCTHCGKNHPSDRCYKTFPHLRPINNTNPNVNNTTTTESDNAQVSSIRVSSTFKLPTFVIDFMGTKAEVLVDTGAAISCISPSFCSKVSLEKAICPRYTTPVQNANGIIVQTLGTIHFEFNNALFPFHVLPGLNSAFIIGWNIIEHMDATINRRSFTFPCITTPLESSAHRHFPLPSPSNNEISCQFTAHIHTNCASIRPVQSLIPFDLSNRIDQLIQENRDLFAPNPKAPPCSNFSPFSIDTGSALPIQTHGPRHSPAEQKIIDDEVQMMLDNNIIKPSRSPWCSPVRLVDKEDGSLRFCVDYRKINAVTTQDAYPIPRIDTLLHALQGATVFSELDMAAAYWQIPIDPVTAKKLAFTTHRGLYEWNVMPFGA